MAEEKEKKKAKKNKVQSFNFKEWLKIALENGLKRGKREAKIPKIKTPFKLLIISCKKSDIKALGLYVAEFGSIMGLDFTGYYVHKNSSAILSANKESSMLSALVPTEKVDGKLAEIAKELKERKIRFYKIYVIAPTSAELNLIYQFKKGDKNGK